MIPFKQIPNGMIKHTAVPLILLCFSTSCFSFVQDSTRRSIDSPFSEYHPQASLKEGPRKVVNQEREVVVLSPYIRDVGADSRQSRIDARDIRTDFREIRTELGRRRFHDAAQDRREERRTIENSREATNNIRFTETDRLDERRDSRREPEYSRRNLHGGDRFSRANSRRYLANREQEGNKLAQANTRRYVVNNNVRTSPYESREQRQYKLERGSRINAQSISRRSTGIRNSGYSDTNPSDRAQFRTERERSSDRRSLEPTQLRSSRNGDDRENSGRNLLDDTRSGENRRRTTSSEYRNDRENSRRINNIRNGDIRSERIEFRSDRESSRRASGNVRENARRSLLNNSIRYRARNIAGESIQERRELGASRVNSRRGRASRQVRSGENRRTTPSDTRERRENLLSNIRSRKIQDSGNPQDQVHYTRKNSDRRSSLNGDSFRFSFHGNRERVWDTTKINYDRKNDSGAHFPRNTGTTRAVAKNNYDFIPSFNYKSDILTTAAQVALVILLFGQILGNASKNKLRLTNWRAIFSKEKIA